jgi:voltage-gated sodium channel
MFVLLTLENLPAYIERGQQLSDWTLLFYVSYVMVASFLIFNLFIGIVINSMEEARAIELHRAERDLLEADPDEEERGHAIVLEERLRALRAAVDELEREVRATHPTRRSPSRERRQPIGGGRGRGGGL